MMILVVGGSGSGKSFYAEQQMISLSQEKDCQKYYLATMKIFDHEGQKKVDRHRRLRSKKGFVTIEQPSDISKALDKMTAKNPVVLLECISNLTANEMFSGETPMCAQGAVQKIIKEIQAIKSQVTHMVVVSNNVFEDGIIYEESVMEYIRAMGIINQKIAAMADTVTEVVVGIPVTVRQEGRGICMS